MFIRKVIEVTQVHLDGREYFICGCGGEWGFPTLPWLAEALEMRGEAPLKQTCSEDTSETSLSVFPFSEWCCGVPKDVLSTSQLFPRLASCAHFRPVL